MFIVSFAAVHSELLDLEAENGWERQRIAASKLNLSDRNFAAGLEGMRAPVYEMIPNLARDCCWLSKELTLRRDRDTGYHSDVRSPSLFRNQSLEFSDWIVQMYLLFIAN